MLEYYLEIRLLHISAVLISGALLAVRGVGLMLGAKWPLSVPWRYLSYAVDTVLLTTALMLMTIVRQYPLVHAWLTVKIVLLVLYIFLGIMAFREGRNPYARFSLWLSALLVYAFIFSVARAHHPMGIFIMSN